jgi:hypothetical protein
MTIDPDDHHRTATTEVLLRCGMLAGPLFIVTSLIEGLARPDYNSLRHPVSSLALGPDGWIQVANFMVPVFPKQDWYWDAIGTAMAQTDGHETATYRVNCGSRRLACLPGGSGSPVSSRSSPTAVGERRQINGTRWHPGRGLRR